MKLITLLTTLALLTGCASTQYRAPRPALIGHIVFVDLIDPNDYDECLRDVDELLGTIPSVATFAAGRHIDTGRDIVLNDYDLAIYLGFESVEDLDAYIVHEQHVACVAKWQPRMNALRIYDMHDPTK
jgi:hypothetical protein